MKRILSCCLILILLAGCARPPVSPRPPQPAPPQEQAAADSHQGAAFLIEPLGLEGDLRPQEDAEAGEAFLASVRVAGPRGEPVEGLVCESGGVRTVTDAEGRCLLPMCSGVPQALSLASEAPAKETQYLVTAREGAWEEELFLLWAAV